MAHPPFPPTGKLPFWGTLAKAIALPFEHAAGVARLTWLWALIIGGLTGLLHRLLDDTQIAAMQAGNTLGPAGLNLVSLLLGLVIGASVAVGWHRLLLRGEQPGSGAYLRLDSTVWSYVALAGLMLLISMPFLATAWVFATKAPELAAQAERANPEIDPWLALLLPFMMIGMWVALFVTTRLSLVLPARAVGVDDLTLSDSWRLTGGSFWRLFGGTLICYLPALLISSLLVSLLGADKSIGSFLAGQALSSMAGIVTSVFPLAFLSLAYRHFTGDGPAPVA